MSNVAAKSEWLCQSVVAKNELLRHDWVLLCLGEMLQGQRSVLLVVWGWVIGVLVCVFGVGEAWSQMAESPCRDLFQQKAFARSAACYERLFLGVDKQTASLEIRNLLKDRYLLHAAIAWIRESRKENRVGLRSYGIEQAMEKLQHSTEKGYCKASNRCLRYLRWLEEWRKEVQYGRLTVVTGHEQAQIVLVGFRYRLEVQGNFSRIVRPGAYELRLNIPGQSLRKEAIVLRKSHHLVVNVTPVKLQVVEKQIVLAQKVPPLVISGYSVGGALGVAGTVLFVYGIVQQLNLNAGRREPEVHRLQSEPDYLQGMEVGRVLAISGTIAAGTGIFLLVGSGIAHQMSRSSRREVPRMDLSMQLGAFGWEASVVSSPVLSASR